MNTLFSLEDAFLRFVAFLLVAFVLIYAQYVVITKIRRKTLYRYYALILYSVSFVLWYIYIKNLIREFQIYSYEFQIAFIVIFTIILLFASWYFIREIISGFSARLTYKLKAGEYIAMDHLEGEIIALRLTTLELLNAEGNKVLVPWTQISNKIITVVSHEENIFLFEHKLILEKTVPFEKLKLHLTSIILNTPGSLITKKPSINLVSSDEHYVIIVSIFAINKQAFDQIIKNIEDNI